jgi:hypothetical protein
MNRTVLRENEEEKGKRMMKKRGKGSEGKRGKGDIA